MIAWAQQPEDRRIVALGSAGVEHHLGLAALEKPRQRLASLVHGPVRRLPVNVN